MKTLHSERPRAAASHRRALPGVTSSLLVSIKDDELEAEGERSPGTEDGGHKNDEVSSVSALMADASRDAGRAGGRRGRRTFQRGDFLVLLQADVEFACVFFSSVRLPSSVGASRCV